MTSRRGGWSPRGRAIVSSCSCHPAETGCGHTPRTGEPARPASSGTAPRGESSFRLRGVKMRAQRPGPTAILSTESTSGERSRTGWLDESLCRPRSPPRPAAVTPAPPRPRCAAAGTTRCPHAADAATRLNCQPAAGFRKSTALEISALKRKDATERSFTASWRARHTRR